MAFDSNGKAGERIYLTQKPFLTEIFGYGLGRATQGTLPSLGWNSPKAYNCGNGWQLQAQTKEVGHLIRKRLPFTPNFTN